MTLVAALTALIIATAPRVPAASYARMLAEEGAAAKIDPFLLEALILHESHWSASVVAHERSGLCAVGLGQVDVPCDGDEQARMLDPSQNIHRMAVLLKLKRKACRAGCANLGWARAYAGRPGPEFMRFVRLRIAEGHAALQRRR